MSRYVIFQEIFFLYQYKVDPKAIQQFFLPSHNIDIVTNQSQNDQFKIPNAQYENEHIDVTDNKTDQFQNPSTQNEDEILNTNIRNIIHNKLFKQERRSFKATKSSILSP